MPPNPHVPRDCCNRIEEGGEKEEAAYSIGLAVLACPFASIAISTVPNLNYSSFIPEKKWKKSTTPSPPSILPPAWRRNYGHLFSKVQIVIQPLPAHNLVDRQTRRTVSKRSEEPETPKHKTINDRRSSPSSVQILGS
jgi:hypothetical protein